MKQYHRVVLIRAAAIVACGLVVPAARAVVPVYTILDLGTLGGIKSEADGLNNSGQVVGWSKTAAGANRAFLTSANSAINVNTDMLPLLGSGTTNFAYGVNSTAQVTGNGSSSTGDRAYRYSGGTMTTLNTLGGTWGYGYAINDSGQVTGGAALSKQGNIFPTHAFLANGTSVFDLGSLGGDSFGYAINSSGTVAGYSQMPTVANVTPEHAMLWTPTTSSGTTGTMADINPLGGNYSYAWGINDLGQVVGGADTPGDAAYHAFFRPAGANPTAIDLGTLGGASSEARDINQRGMIVGYSDTGSASHAFLYADGAMRDLNNLLLSNGGWVLSTATAVNDVGQIAGTGTNSLGQSHAYLLTPLPTWAVNSSGNWTTLSNWIGQVPNASGAEAWFTNAITAPRTVTLDASATVGHLLFDSASSYTLAGPGSLTINGPAANTGIEVRSGAHTIAAPLNITSAATISIANNSSLKLSGHVTGAITGLSLTGSAVLDLTNNSLVIDYNPADGSPLAGITAAIISARNGGSWNGPGITSSAAAADSSHRTTIGVAEASTLGLGSFAGAALDGSDVLLRYTYIGDANLDGQVDVTDLGALATHWQSSAAWTGGDFNYDGVVDVSDLGALATNWQAGVGNPLGAGSLQAALEALGLGGVPVPESATALFIMALASILQRRARSHP